MGGGGGGGGGGINRKSVCVGHELCVDDGGYKVHLINNQPGD